MLTDFPQARTKSRRALLGIFSAGALIVAAVIIHVEGVSRPREEDVRMAAGDLKRIVGWLEDYYSRHNRYPSKAEFYSGISSDLEERLSLVDPWGRRYIYIAPGTRNPDYDLSSLGADGIESLDDVTNW